MLPAHYRKNEVSYFCRFTFGQFFTLLVIEIFTLFFIFYLGARYGKELLGLEIQGAIALPAKESPLLSATNPDAVAMTKDPEIQAMAKELLQSAPTPDLKERVTQMLENNSETPKEEKDTKGVEEKPLVAKEPLVPKDPPVIETNPFRSRFSVQVGSYSNVDEAHAMVGQWKARGYPAYLVSADIPQKGRWYRVRLGGFESREEADTYLNELVQKEKVEAFVSTNDY